jgi:hypothetical protein
MLTRFDLPTRFFIAAGVEFGAKGWKLAFRDRAQFEVAAEILLMRESKLKPSEIFKFLSLSL